MISAEYSEFSLLSGLTSDETDVNRIRVGRRLKCLDARWTWRDAGRSMVNLYCQTSPFVKIVKRGFVADDDELKFAVTPTTFAEELCTNLAPAPPAPLNN